MSLLAQATNDRQPVVDPSEIVKGMMNWLTYQRDYLIWSEDYIALDTSFNAMSRLQFLEQLTTGRFLPLKIKKLG